MTEEPSSQATSPKERQLIIALSVLAFTVMFSYALVRPAVESLFLEVHGSTALPWAWLAIAPTMVVTLAAYNRLMTGRDLSRVFALANLVCAVLFVGLWVSVSNSAPGAIFVGYVVKDVYVIVLVEIFWTTANAHFRLKEARWLYGWFCFVSSLAGVVGNLSVGWLADTMGTSGALVVAAVPLALSAALSTQLQTERAPERTRDSGGWSVVKSSDYLVWLFAMICTIQIVITLVDYVFNTVIETSFPNVDVRTARIGEVYAVIAAGSAILQLGAGVVLRLAGVTKTLIAVPVLVGTALLGFVAAPGFALIAFVKVASKVLDYSVFRVAKELLYLPLTPFEKTRGKAVVDLFGYRAAKAGASLLVLGLVGLQLPLTAVAVLAMAGIVAWVGMTVVIARRYREKAAP